MAKLEERIWVTSGTGKAICLIDTSLRQKASDEPVRVEITQRMADEGIGIEVVATDFIKHKITPENLLKELPNAAAAKKAYDEYQKKVKTEQKERQETLDEIGWIAKATADEVKAKVQEFLTSQVANSKKETLKTTVKK